MHNSFQTNSLAHDGVDFGMTELNALRLKYFPKFHVDTRGVTALEYGLIAAVVGATIAVAFSSYGTRLAAAFAAIRV